MKLLLYCTKAKPYLADFKGEYQTYSNSKELDDLFDKGFNPNDIMNILNGKIVAECDFEVEEIRLNKGLYITNTLREREIVKCSCLSFCELADYLGGHNGYAIHIKNLHIFDEPKELYYVHMNKAPQNMCYGWTFDDEYLLPDACIVVSIRPKWLCKILNGEKTIEVRKKVLKEML